MPIFYLKLHDVKVFSQTYPSHLHLHYIFALKFSINKYSLIERTNVKVSNVANRNHKLKDYLMLITSQLIYLPLLHMWKIICYYNIDMVLFFLSFVHKYLSSLLYLTSLIILFFWLFAGIFLLTLILFM